MSVGRRIERLTLDHLADLPGHCAECVFWELDPVRRDAAGGHAGEEKAAWVSMVLREWGSCGRVAVMDGRVVGHMIWAPPVHVPAAGGFATAPVSSDAVIMTTAYVDPEHRGGGLGRMLMQGLIVCAKRRGLERLEGTVLRENEAMRSFVRTLGFRVDDDPGDATQVIATLPLG